MWPPSLAAQAQPGFRLEGLCLGGQTSDHEMVVEGETMSAVDKAMNMLTLTVDVRFEPDNIMHAQAVSIVSVRVSVVQANYSRHADRLGVYKKELE